MESSAEAPLRSPTSDHSEPWPWLDKLFNFAGCVSWVNSQTAGFCEDHQRPKEFQRPRSRVIARFVFTVAVCMLLILLVLLLLFTQEATFRTVRYWGSSYALQHFTPFIYSPNATQDPSYKTSTASTLCPCSNTAFTWTSFVQFFTISNHLQRTSRTSYITNGSDFCTNKVSHLNLSKSLITSVGCPNLVNSIVSQADQRTILTSTSLMDPVLLNTTVTRYMQSNLDKALNDCVFLMSDATSWNVSEHFEWLRDIYEVFTYMRQLYGSNSHVSDDQFWSMANGTNTTSSPPILLTQVLDNKLALGMQVNWTSYVEECSPIYCDVVEETSVAYKFFSSLAQIGGFGALMLVVIRKIMWPSLCFLCGWPVA